MLIKIFSLYMLMGAAIGTAATSEFLDDAAKKKTEEISTKQERIQDFFPRHQQVFRRFINISIEYENQKTEGLNPDPQLSLPRKVILYFLTNEMDMLERRSKDLEKGHNVAFDENLERLWVTYSERADVYSNYVKERLALNRNPIVNEHRLSLDEQKVEAVKRAQASYEAAWRDGWLIGFGGEAAAKKAGGEKLAGVVQSRDALVEKLTPENTEKRVNLFDALTESIFDEKRQK